MTYRVFGLQLQCSDPIPGLAVLPDLAACPERSRRAVDVEVWLDPAQCWPEDPQNIYRAMWYRSAGRSEDADSIVTVWSLAGGAFYWIRYDDGIEFLLNRTGTGIWCRWPDPFTVEDACTYLLGPVLGFVLRLRGITCLHASAIDVGGKAVALVGRGGSGKSTAAAVFAESGYAVLSDDVVALGDYGTAFLVCPAYPRLGLWPDSVNALFGSPDILPRQTPNWDKRYLDLTTNGYRFQTEPRPLEAIYLLGERETAVQAPRVETVAPRAGLIQLIENAYVSYLLDAPMRARDFDVLGRIATLVAIRRIVPPATAASLPKLRDAILEDLGAHSAPARERSGVLGPPGEDVRPSRSLGRSPT